MMLKTKFNSVILTVHTIISILLLLTPIALNIPVNVIVKNNLPVYVAVESIDYRISLYVSLFASIIMSLELIFQLSVEPALIFSFKNFLATILLVMWLIVSDCILLTYVTINVDLRYFVLLHQARFILLSWSVAIYLNLYCDSKFWGSPLAICPVVAINSIRIFSALSTYFTFPKVLVTTLVVGAFLSLTSLIVQSLRWFLFIYNTSKIQQITKNEYLCGIYVVANLCCNIGIIICVITRRSPLWYNMNTDDLVSQSYVYTAFYLIFVAFQGRVMEREALMSQNALEVKRMFIRYMSHEIRTPLNTVMMGLQHLQEDMKKWDDCPKRLETVEDAIESCEIAIKTLNNMLLYDKIENKLLMLDKSTIQVQPFLNKIIKLFRVQANYMRVSISLTYIPMANDGTFVSWNELTLYADAEKLAQVVRNIISNALKFTPTNGNITIEVRKVSVDIQSSSASTSDMLELRVIDNGAGISMENQNKLFHGIIQFTPGKLQDGGGSGLGLYIAKGIVDAHGGLLTVTSEGEGRGCTFTISLPVIEEPPVISPLQPQDLPPARILIHSGKSPPVASKKFVIKNSTRNKQSWRTKSTWWSRSLTWSWSRPWKSQSVYVDGKTTCVGNNSNSNLRERKPLSSSSLALQGTMLPTSIIASDKDNVTVFTREVENEQERKVDVNDEDENEDKVEVGQHIIIKESLRNSIEVEELPVTMTELTTRNSSTKTTRKPVILVVDDVASNRKMMRRLLQNRSEYTIDAINGQEAVSMISEALSQHRHIDVITMDYQMPVMDGPTATKQIRELGYTGIILGVTGNALAEDIAEFISCGANKVLIKPLKVAALDEALLELLPSSYY